jgi:hypothetical protein
VTDFGRAGCLMPVWSGDDVNTGIPCFVARLGAQKGM